MIGTVGDKLRKAEAENERLLGLFKELRAAWFKGGDLDKDHVSQEALRIFIAAERGNQQPRNTNDVIAELTPDERAKVEARALELISQQTTLCRNCKAPIDDGHKEFCGMCREMGCS